MKNITLGLITSILCSSVFWITFKRTEQYGLISMPISVLLGFGITLLLILLVLAFFKVKIED